LDALSCTEIALNNAPGASGFGVTFSKSRTSELCMTVCNITVVASLDKGTASLKALSSSAKQG
jgi:hypothetical protein